MSGLRSPELPGATLSRSTNRGSRGGLSATLLSRQGAVADCGGSLVIVVARPDAGDTPEMTQDRAWHVRLASTSCGSADVDRRDFIAAAVDQARRSVLRSHCCGRLQWAA